MKSDIADRLFGSLTVCRRAGFIVAGFDSAKDSLAEGKAKLILVAADASEKTKKEISYYADRANVPVMSTPAVMEEYERHIGKRSAVIAVCDEGFADSIRDKLTSDGSQPLAES